MISLEPMESQDDAPHTETEESVVGQNPEFRVVIRGDRDVPAIFVSQAMNAAAEAGISDISFSAVNHD